jgi:hypothetical protein
MLGGRFPERVLEKAVERMLPKESPLARKQMTHLRIYTTAEHPHAAQNPEDHRVRCERQEHPERVTCRKLKPPSPRRSRPPPEAPAATGNPEGPHRRRRSIVYEKKVDAQGRAYATGKRKNAIAACGSSRARA